MGTSSVTAAQDFKDAFYQAAVGLFADKPREVLVSYGHPGAKILNYPVTVGFADLEAGQDAATLGTNRSREETLTLTVWIVSFKAGHTDDRAAAARAYEVLGVLEKHVRVTDTTLGGVVRQCFLTTHRSTGETDPNLLASGRTIDLEATFTAQCRITGP